MSIPVVTVCTIISILLYIHHIHHTYTYHITCIIYHVSYISQIRCPQKKNPQGGELLKDLASKATRLRVPMKHIVVEGPPGLTGGFLKEKTTAFQQEKNNKMFGWTFFWGLDFGLELRTKQKLALKNSCKFNLNSWWNLVFFEGGLDCNFWRLFRFGKYHAIRSPSKDLRFGAPCHYKSPPMHLFVAVKNKRKVCRAPAFNFSKHGFCKKEKCCVAGYWRWIQWNFID